MRVKPETMNKTEVKAFRWLVKQGAGDIRFNYESSPDFIVDGDKGYEAKRLSPEAGSISFTEKQRKMFDEMDPTILVFADSCTDPIAVAPYKQIIRVIKNSEHPLFREDNPGSGGTVKELIVQMYLGTRDPTHKFRVADVLREGRSRTTVWRLLTELVDAGVLQRVDKSYAVSPKFRDEMREKLRG